MKNKCGFTLIEVMIALACMVGALSVTISLSFSLYRSWQQTAKTAQTRVTLHAALDAIRRDFEHAPCKRAQWYQTGMHECVWHDLLSSRVLRLCLVEGRLERCEGSYDQRTHKWHTRSTSVLAQGIQELRITFHHKDASHYTAAEVTLLSLEGSQEYALIALGVGALL